MSESRVSSYLVNIRSELQSGRGLDLSENDLVSLFIVPIFLDYLGFGSLDCITPQYKLSGSLDRPDLLLRARKDTVDKKALLVEAKQCGRIELRKQLQFGPVDIHDQVRKYFLDPESPEQAILTDGLTWIFLINRTLLQGIGKENVLESLTEETAFPVFSFNINDDDFWSYLLIMNRDKYNENTVMLARALAQKAKPSLGAGIKTANLFYPKIEDKSAREKLGQAVSEQINLRFQKKGRRTELPGTILQYQDEGLTIQCKVDESGQIQVIPVRLIINGEVFRSYPMLTGIIPDWLKDESKRNYRDFGELVKTITGKSYEPRKGIEERISSLHPENQQLTMDENSIEPSS